MNSLKELSEEYATYAQDIGGCSNHSCVIWRKGGMGTNANCKCTRTDDPLRQARIGHLLRLAQKIVKILQDQPSKADR